MTDFYELGSLSGFMSNHMRDPYDCEDTSGSLRWLTLLRRFASEVLCALDFLHNEKHVVYRELIPDKIFIAGSEKEPHLKLGDFGMSACSEVGNGNFFTAPEMLEHCAMARHGGSKRVVVRSSLDVFSFGLLVYVMVHGYTFDDFEGAFQAPHSMPDRAMVIVPHPYRTPTGSFSQKLTELQRAEVRCPKEVVEIIEASTHLSPRQRSSVKHLKDFALFQEMHVLEAAAPLPSVSWQVLRQLEF